MSKKLKKENATNKSQATLGYDYRRIEKLREEAWARPEVQKNWEEFEKKQQRRKK